MTKQSRWDRVMSMADSPPIYDGMSKQEIWEHEKWLDRKVAAHQKFWRRVKSIQLSYTLTASHPENVFYYLFYDSNGQLIGRAKWTSAVAYSLAREYGWLIKKPT